MAGAMANIMVICDIRRWAAALAAIAALGALCAPAVAAAAQRIEAAHGGRAAAGDADAWLNRAEGATTFLAGTLHKAAVNLENIRVHAFQPRIARIAGAKIIKRKPDAHAQDLVQYGHGMRA